MVNKKSNISSEPRCELVINCTSKVCKDIVEKFVVISLLLKESTILFRGQSVILNNKIDKSSTYINSSNLKFKKKKILRGGRQCAFVLALNSN